MISSYDQARRRAGFGLYVVLLGAVACLPLAIKATKWVPETDRLFYAAFWGSLVGMMLARSPLPDWLSWLVGVMLGAEYSAQFAGKLLPSLATVGGDLQRVVAWVWDLVAHQTVGSTLPLSRSTSHILVQAEAMIGNLADWLAAVRSGGTSQDNTALWLATSFGIWLLAYNAGFELFRRRRTFVAMLPLGGLVVANVAYTGIGMAYVHFFLAFTLLTLVRANVERMEALWARLGLDFSAELRRDATLAGSFLSAAVLVVALVIPYMTYNRAVFFFWNRYGPKFMSFYEELDRAFAGRNPVPEPTPGGRGLPAHSIASGGVLDRDVVFLVETSDPIPIPDEELEMMALEGVGLADLITKRYWRERTYDSYTGHGWDNSERSVQVMRGNDSWTQVAYPHDVVTQTFSLLKRPLGLAFGVNEPIKVDQSYRVLVRGDEDLAAFSLDSDADVYTVVSWAPEPTIDQLQEAEGEYPDWVRERYLALPDSLPARVRGAAEEVAEEAGAVSRYEKARAIETHIRRFDYDLDLEPPPLDTDVVDYFLFTAQRGYCDYSATAMVVMLRSLGVAARYASGFAMGSYDYGRGAWVVSGDYAHAWSEVYFPGYGWIEFEPTPSQGVFVRPSSWPDIPLGPGGEEGVEGRWSLPPLWLMAAGLVVALLFVIIWPPRWFRRSGIEPRENVWRVYSNLVRRARWAGLSPYGGQTPREYLRALGLEMERRAAFAGGSAQEIRLIQRAYERARYSDEPTTREESHRVEGSWRRLRGKLLRLAFVRTQDRSSPS